MLKWTHTHELAMEKDFGQTIITNFPEMTSHLSGTWLETMMAILQRRWTLY